MRARARGVKCSMALVVRREGGILVARGAGVGLIQWFLTFVVIGASLRLKISPRTPLKNVALLVYFGKYVCCGIIGLLRSKDVYLCIRAEGYVNF